MNPSLPVLFGRQLSRVHCVGVAGMGLGPLALQLAGLGFSVSGEDDAPGGPMRGWLRRAGVRLGPPDQTCELVVCSSAIRPEHPTAIFAREQGIPVVRRGELLAELCHTHKLVAVCGSHGKTTTTAMLITALRQSGFPFGYVLGGVPGDETMPPAQVGGDWLVAEIDESDGTIGRFSPELTVVTNLDWDHPDYYSSEQDFLETFGALFSRTRGTVLLNSACALSLDLVGRARRWQAYGPGGNFDYSIQKEDASGLELSLSESFGIERARVGARGEFNAANAAAALAAAHLMGAPLSEGVLSGYASVRRRQAVLLQEDGWSVVEDYAHHPSEIAALLGSLRSRVGEGGRLLVVFQPHRYSRTLQFKTRFAEVLGLADEIHLLEVYSAGEDRLPEGSGHALFEALDAKTRARTQFHGEDAAGCFDLVGSGLRAGDCLAVVGAGDVDQEARHWLSRRRWAALRQRLAAKLPAACTLRCAEPLASKTTLRVGGKAALYAEPPDEACLSVLLGTLSELGLPWYVLGRGSNVLVPDEGVEGLVLSLTGGVWSSCTVLPDGQVRAGAGLRLKELCARVAREGMQGFEFLEGIPGTVGGALFMNAGAMGGWIFDLVVSLRLMDAQGHVHTLTAAEAGADYRHCAALKGAIALDAVLRATGPETQSAIQAKMEAYRVKRQATQPREPSAGCMFRNPEGDSAGRLVDSCGLKGESIGDAEVSRVHANFIINRGSASATDVLTLVRRVRARVRARTGVDLQPEVRLLGADWSDVL